VSEKKTGKGQVLETFVTSLCRLAWFVLGISAHGLKRNVLTKTDRILGLLAVYAVIFVFVVWNWKYLVILHFCLPWFFPMGLMQFIVLHISMRAQFLILAGSVTVNLGVVVGIAHFLKMRKYEKALAHIGLKSATGLAPKVMDVEEPEEFKKKITLLSLGVGLEQYQNKKSDIESALGAIVENIRVPERNRKLVEIYLAEKELPTTVGYQECLEQIEK
jgi:hypothetical protein